QVASDHLLGRDNAFTGADMSAKLKLLGVDVGGIGDARGTTPGARSVVWLDESKSIYKRLIISEDQKTLLGAVLVGDTSDYGNLLQLVLNAIPLPANPEALILPAGSGDKPAIGVDSLPDTAQICSCFDVSKGDIIKAVQGGCHTVAALKSSTRAGTGCGGCIPLITQVLNSELSRQGIEVNNHLCAHFAWSRQELYHLIQVEEIKTFDELLARYGQGYGCEGCKPVVGSLLASCWNEYVLKPQHAPLQDSNELYLGNIQKDGTYSVIPRSPGGEITPQGLNVI
ncbi:MAG TPA: nitrite reductase (NAD(P)H), partial [Pantoea agglomerans]|nr:nitrite reductase (NAD(P)H) [Pantoea agglomerans]